MSLFSRILYGNKRYHWSEFSRLMKGGYHTKKGDIVIPFKDWVLTISGKYNSQQGGFTQIATDIQLRAHKGISLSKETIYHILQTKTPIVQPNSSFNMYGIFNDEDIKEVLLRLNVVKFSIDAQEKVNYAYNSKITIIIGEFITDHRVLYDLYLLMVLLLNKLEDLGQLVISQNSLNAISKYHISLDSWLPKHWHESIWETLARYIGGQYTMSPNGKSHSILYEHKYWPIKLEMPLVGKVRKKAQFARMEVGIVQKTTLDFQLYTSNVVNMLVQKRLQQFSLSGLQNKIWTARCNYKQQLIRLINYGKIEPLLVTHHNFHLYLSNTNIQSNIESIKISKLVFETKDDLDSPLKLFQLFLLFTHLLDGLEYFDLIYGIKTDIGKL